MLINPQPPMAGHIFGLQLSNNSTTPSTTLDVSTGVAADSTNTYQVQLPSTFSKVLQSTGSWASGSGNNGLDSGARVASTWYHVFLIRADINGVGDILFSTSFSSPAMPPGYTAKRRIGSILTDASNNILVFTQTGDEFIWFDATYDVQGITTLGNTSTLFTLSVPPDIKVQARVRISVSNNGGAAAGQMQCSVRSPDENASQNTRFVNGSGHQLWTKTTTIAGGTSAAELLVRTNTAKQIAAITDQAMDNLFYVRTIGWMDERGRMY